MKHLDSRYLLPAILFIALGLRLVAIDQSFWLDEASHAIRSSGQWGDQFDLVKDFHPPLGYVVTYVFARFGSAEAWLRLSSVIPGVLTVYVAYLIGLQVSRRTGLIAAGLLAVAPYHIYYSQELRMYALSALLSSVLIYSLLSRRWILHTIALSMSLYTLYLLPFVVVAELAWVIMIRFKEWKRWLASCVVSAILFLPWLPTFSGQLENGRALPSIWPVWTSLSSVSTYKVVPLTLAKFVLGRISFDSNEVYGLVLLLCLPFVILPILQTLGINYRSRLWKKYWDNSVGEVTLMIQLWLGVPFIIALGFSVWLIPINGPWRLLFILPALYVLVAIGVTKIQYIKVQRIFLIGIFGVSLLGSGMYLLQPRFHREAWKEVNQDIRHELTDDSRIVRVVNVFPEPFAPMIWYGNDLPIVGVLDGLTVDSENLDGLLSNKIGDAEVVYYFDYLDDLTDPDLLVLRWLEEQGFKEVEIKDYRDVGFVRTLVRDKFDEFATL